jgi:uncharacterized membrane protein YkoI
MKNKNIITTLTLAAVLAVGLTACESEKENEGELKAQAKIAEADARQTALAKVPNGTIKESELEKEHGHLQWSFDMTTPGEKNITEVNIDAITGNVLNIGKEAPDAD